MGDGAWRRLERRGHYGLQVAAHAVVHTLTGRRPRDACRLEEAACARNFAVRGYRHHVRGLDTPPCCRGRLLEVLDEVTALLHGTGWCWFAFWGTWLGAVRHEGLIPWDRDADLVVLDVEPAEIVEVLAPLTRGRAPRRLRQRPAVPGVVTVQASRTNGVGVDVEAWRSRGDRLEAHDPAVGERPRRAEVFPLARRAFEGRPLPVPRDLALLRRLYGPDCLVRGVRFEQRLGDRRVALHAAHGLRGTDGIRPGGGARPVAAAAAPVPSPASLLQRAASRARAGGRPDAWPPA